MQLPRAPALGGRPAPRRSFAASAARSSRTPDGPDPAPPPPTDLRTVPGVGVKTELLLLARGIATVADLGRVFRTDAGGEVERMVEYLQVRGGGGMSARGGGAGAGEAPLGVAAARC